MIRSGELRERVTVQTPVEYRNPLGETVLTWEDFATVWASVEGTSVRETLLFGQQDIAVTHKVVMRYLDGLNGKMRLIWRSRVLEVISVLEHENRSRHELVCQEAS